MRRLRAALAAILAVLAVCCTPTPSAQPPLGQPKSDGLTDEAEQDGLATPNDGGPEFETAVDTDLPDALDIYADAEVLAQASDAEIVGGQPATCPLTWVKLIGSSSDSFVGVASDCDESACWIATVSPMPYLPYSTYGASVLIYRWVWSAGGSGTVDKAVVVGGEQAMETRHYPTGLRLVAGGALLVGNTYTSSGDGGEFRCTLSNSLEVSCLSAASPGMPPHIAQVTGGPIAYLSTAETEPGAPVVVLGTLLPTAPPTLKITGTVQLGPFPAPSNFTLCGQDLVFGHKPCQITRVNPSGQALWEASWVPQGDGESLPPSGCNVIAATADCNRVFLQDIRVTNLGPTLPEHFLIAGNGNTGAKLSVVPQIVPADQWSDRGVWVEGSELAVWYAAYLASMPEPRLAWHDVATLRLVGTRVAPLLPTLALLQAASRVPGTAIVSYVAESLAAGSAIAGLADTWGNTTCDQSGPCWQKTYTDCQDTNPCTSDLCDAAHGGCYHVPLPDGITCSDAGGHCTAGTCGP